MMYLNNFNRTIYSHTMKNINKQKQLFHYFQNTPHFVFMNFEYPPISRNLQFPSVKRITLINSNRLYIQNMIYSNFFPNVSYIRELLDINSFNKNSALTENLLKNTVEHSHSIIDYDISYIDFATLDIKKISNNFNGYNVGDISNIEYTNFLIEYIKQHSNEYIREINNKTQSTYMTQDIEEKSLQQKNVLDEIKRNEYMKLC